MCLVCIEINRGKLTTKEMTGALREQVLFDKDHAKEIIDQLEATDKYDKNEIYGLLYDQLDAVDLWWIV